MKKVLDDKGFTLIELVVVIGIIGLLAALALPNFMMYQAKSRQAEATSNLGAIFTNEQSYFSEKDSYTEDLIACGAGISGMAKRYDFTAKSDYSEWIGKSVVPPALTGTGPPLGTDLNFSDPDHAPHADNSHFSAIATGDIDSDGAYDLWSINDKYVLVNDFNDAVQ